MARQRYCRRLARYRNTLRVSADPVAKPAAHTRAESRGSRPSKADAGERRTVCWREMDSNHRYPANFLASPSIPPRLLNRCRTAWLRCEEGFVADSLLEGDGFEPSRSPVCGELGAPGPRATRPRAIVKPRNADRSRRQARRAIGACLGRLSHGQSRPRAVGDPEHLAASLFRLLGNVRDLAGRYDLSARLLPK